MAKALDYDGLVKAITIAPLTFRLALLIKAVETAAGCFQSDDDLKHVVHQTLAKFRRANPSPWKCPHCGAPFNGLSDDLIPTHDFPKPCRSVCPGSRNDPRAHGDTRPLWKDEQ